jgi:hypothetical protein
LSMSMMAICAGTFTQPTATVPIRLLYELLKIDIWYFGHQRAHHIFHHNMVSTACLYVQSELFDMIYKSRFHALYQDIQSALSTMLPSSSPLQEHRFLLYSAW